jgi:hypothetical protein
VYGIKDSSGDMTYFAELIRKLAEAIAMGAHGWICGGSNLWPELYVSLAQAASNRDTERIRELAGDCHGDQQFGLPCKRGRVSLFARYEVRALDSGLLPQHDGGTI